MKSPGKELPEQDAGEKLSEYAGTLVVFNKGWRHVTRDTKFGKRDTIEVDVWARVDGEWKGLGDVPVFFSTVMKQLDEAGPDEPFGGFLVQGTDRNPREWCIEAATKKDDVKALAEWTDSF